MTNRLNYTHFAEDVQFRQQLTRYAELFDAPIRRRWDKYLRDADRLKSILSKALLYHALRREYPYCTPANFVLRYDALGRPYIDQPGFDFNISHSRDLIACAVSYDGCIGIDVQSRADRNSFLRFGKAVAGLAPQMKTIDLEEWTSLEAAGKCAGSGLKDLKSVLDRKKEFVIRSVPIDREFVCRIATRTSIDIHPERLNHQELTRSIDNQIRESEKTRYHANFSLPKTGHFAAPPATYAAGR